MLADMLRARLEVLNSATDRGDDLLRRLEQNVESEKTKMKNAHDMNLKKLDQYARMKRVLIEAALSEISADIFRTESLLTAVDVVSETQEISGRPIPSMEISVDDLPQLGKDAKLAESLAQKDQEISDLKDQLVAAKLALVKACQAQLVEPQTTGKQPKIGNLKEIFADISGPLSRLDFFTRLHGRGHKVAEIEALMLKATDENGDVWLSRIS